MLSIWQSKRNRERGHAMSTEHESGRSFATFLGGAVLGLAAMYMLDPDRGRRRRAIVGDKAASLALDTQRALRAATRDATHRIEGLRARARHLLTDEPVPDDLQLIERVRARMGRLVSHPHAIQVGANRGRVTLSGPVLAYEVDRLLDAVRSVWGVSSLDNKLAVYNDADSISSLQGSGESPAAQARYDHWTPTARGAAIIAGSGLSLFGLSERSVLGLVFAAGGAALAVRGATNRPLFADAQTLGEIDERLLPVPADEAVPPNIAQPAGSRTPA
jgi:osmotically-inducible protein OsmY